jgi:hypothetical protein
MMQAIWVAIAAAAASAVTVPALYKLRALFWPPYKPFEPGLCEDLPIHPWDLRYGGGRCRVFWCPQCGANAGCRRPPYCAERGGHFHFKCTACGYEWAMMSLAYKKPPEPEKPEP